MKSTAVYDLLLRERGQEVAATQWVTPGSNWRTWLLAGAFHGMDRVMTIH